MLLSAEPGGDLYTHSCTLVTEGNQIQIDRDNSNNGSINRVTTNTYNANRDVLVFSEETNNDRTFNKIHTKTYDAYGNVLTFEEDADGDPCTNNITYTKTYTYDLSGNALTATEINDADATVAYKGKIYM